MPAGLLLALRFPNHPPVVEDSGTRFRAWGAILPATLIFALAAGGEFLVQAGAVNAEAAALRVSGILLLEALGAALVGRFRLPLRWLPVLVGGALVVGGPAVYLVFLAAGMAPSLRSQLLQEASGEEERAQVLSAASTIDMLARMLILPLAGALA